MQIVAYLGFTLLSVFVQFSVIDFIQGRLKQDEKPNETKGVSQRRQLRDVLKDVEPHALYYRTLKNKGIKNSMSPAKFISNTSLIELLATTDLTTAVFDIMYDENTTSTEESFTTEPIYTTTDIENITEITFLVNSNETTTKIDSKLKTAEDCSCNFLLNVCDINCCCDSDCLDSETDLFPNCSKSKNNVKVVDEDCVSQLPFFGYGNGLFCIVKVNLPEKRKLVIKKTEPVPTNHDLFSWKSNEKSQILYEFSNSMYKHGDPVWLLKNGTIYHTDLPVPTVNSYCTGRKTLQFLKDEKYKCNVKIGDLEILQIMKSLEEVSVISATPVSMNSSVLNCSNLYCVNWTIVVCEHLVCTNYTKTLHEPTCTETICTNLALKMDYIFYYHDLKIVNATIKFHLENITMNFPFISQEIQVKYVIGNESVDKILKLSGNPGYLDGLPIIKSYAESNYTDAFYNSSMQSQRYLLVPENKSGFCALLNSSENFVLFGKNRRIHCGYNHKAVKHSNATDQCQSIQNDINKFLELNRQILVSPLGNPHNLEDNEWVSIKTSLYKGTLYGQVQDRSAKLLCFNLVLRCSMIFSYIQINGNRIVSVNYITTGTNATFNLDDISSVITIDINFIDVTRPSVFEYVKSRPSLNFHFPDDFFYPFLSNESIYLKCNEFIMILCFITYFLQMK